MICQHKFELNRSGNRAYCVHCGAAAVDPWIDGVTEPGPVRLPTREEILADQRKARWQPIETVPDDRPVIVSRTYDQGEHWIIQRKYAGQPPYIYGREATHWTEDTLGCPVN